MLKHPALRSLGKIWRLLDRGDRWQLAGIGVLMLIGSLWEALGVGLVLPFIAVVEKTGTLKRPPILARGSSNPCRAIPVAIDPQCCPRAFICGQEPVYCLEHLSSVGVSEQ